MTRDRLYEQLADKIAGYFTVKLVTRFPYDHPCSMYHFQYVNALCTQGQRYCALGSGSVLCSYHFFDKYKMMVQL